jgi:hypothetical protein
MDILKNIKKVNAPDDLFAKIQARIELSKKPLSIGWVTKLAAVFLIGFLSFETYYVVNQFKLEKATILTELKIVSDNNLYYD